MKTAVIILLMLVGVVISSAKAELQRGEVVVLPKQDWPRSLLVTGQSYDDRTVNQLENPTLQLKWAIVTGNFGEDVDRVRVRLLFNGEREKWVDLYSRKNASEQYDRNVVRLRKFDDSQDAIDESSDGTNKDEDLEESNMVDLRIEHWDHNRLLIKLTDNRTLKDTYFRFDLTQDLSN